MKWLALLALVLAVGCKRPAPPVDVDALNAQSQAVLQAQVDRERDTQKP